MIKRIKIWWIKRQAINLYLEYNQQRNMYDCGDSLLDHITGGRMHYLKTEFNATLDKLQILDPDNTPVNRL